MTRGEGGWLLLPSAGLSPAILRQFAWRTPAGAVQRRTHRPSARPRPAPADHRDAARPRAGRSRGLRASAAARVGGHHPHFRIDTRPVPAARRGDGSRAQTPTAGLAGPTGSAVRAGPFRRRWTPPVRKTAGRPAPTTASSTVEATRVRPGICQTNPRRASETAASRLISGSCLPGK